jgi:hypothetical protein
LPVAGPRKVVATQASRGADRSRGPLPTGGFHGCDPRPGAEPRMSELCKTCGYPLGPPPAACSGRGPGHRGALQARSSARSQGSHGQGRPRRAVAAGLDSRPACAGLLGRRLASASLGRLVSRLGVHPSPSPQVSPSGDPYPGATKRQKAPAFDRRLLPFSLDSPRRSPAGEGIARRAGRRADLPSRPSFALPLD